MRLLRFSFFRSDCRQGEAVKHPYTMTPEERLERAVYLGLDRDGIRAKYVRGRKVPQG